MPEPAGTETTENSPRTPSYDGSRKRVRGTASERLRGTQGLALSICRSTKFAFTVREIVLEREPHRDVRNP